MNSRIKQKYIANLEVRDDKMMEHVCQGHKHVTHVKESVVQLKHDARVAKARYDDTLEDVNNTIAKLNAKYKNRKHLIY